MERKMNFRMGALVLLATLFAVSACGGKKGKNKKSRNQDPRARAERAQGNGDQGKGDQGKGEKVTPPRNGGPERIQPPPGTKGDSVSEEEIKKPSPGSRGVVFKEAPALNEHFKMREESRSDRERVEYQMNGRRGPLRSSITNDIEAREKALRDRELALKRRDEVLEERVEESRQERREIIRRAQGRQIVFGDPNAEPGTLKYQEYQAGANFNSDGSFLGVEAICGIEAKLERESFHLGLGYVRGIGKGQIECEPTGKPFGAKPIPPIKVQVELEGFGVGAEVGIDFQFKGIPFIKLLKEETVHIFSGGIGFACREEFRAIGTNFEGEYLITKLHADVPLIGGVGVGTGLMAKQKFPVKGCPAIVIPLGLEIIGPQGLEAGATLDFTKMNIYLDPDEY